MDEKLPENSQQSTDENKHDKKSESKDTTESVSAEAAVTEKKLTAEQAKTTPPSQLPPPPQAHAQAQAQKVRSGPGWVIWGITLLIAIAAAGANVYLWKSGADKQQQTQQLRADVAGAIQRVDEQSGLVRNVRRELDRYDSLIGQQRSQTQQQINQLNQQLASQRKRIQSLSTTDRNDWLLAEVEYLLHLANQRLLMGKEVKGAQRLLNAADDIVRDLDDYALFPVRKALADDMAALNAVSRFDIEGLYLQLEAGAKQAAQLRLLAELQLDTRIESMPEVQNWQQRLEFGLQAAFNKFKKYIQYKRRDDIYQPALAPEYEPAVRQNVQLMFEQAQMALLAGKQSLYDKSLAKAKNWLNTYYTLDKQASAKVIAMIDQLQQQQVAVTLPDISGSANALKDYLESLHVKENNSDATGFEPQQDKSAVSDSDASQATHADAGQTL